MNNDPVNLAADIARGHKRSMARAITKIENDDPDARIILDYIHENTGKAHRLGITGPPGVGKSTLTTQLIKSYRQKNRTVGVVAVDPSSPFTGGAILGDRIRMQELFTDPDVFIRSMATRGSLGGLARQASEVVDILDASGKDLVIMETVGVGQVELDIMDAADTVIVIAVPDMGDAVQGMKAGLMEIGDIFVVNKADLDGAERMKIDLEFVLDLRMSSNGWAQNVLLAESRKGAGIEEVCAEIDRHREYLNQHGLLTKKRRKRKIERIRGLISEKLNNEFWDTQRLKHLDQLVDEMSPYAIVEKILK